MLSKVVNFVTNSHKTYMAELIRRHEKLVSATTLLLLIFVIWSWFYNILGLSAWKVPLGYGGDGWLIFGTAKAYMQGDIFPLLSKIVPSLNAPFSANWNDYPITEDIIYAVMGWMGKIIGLFAAANLMLLSAHILAGLCFWYVCRELKYDPILSFAGALVYAFCYFILTRGLGHLPLTYFWHIPLLLLVTGWAFSQTEFASNSRQFRLGVVTAVVCGILNPYYSGMFLQFIGFGFLLHIVRKQYSKARFCLVLICATLGAFVLMNADTFIYALLNGINYQAAGRNLAALEVYGLKIPELIFAPGYHPWRAFEKFSREHYYAKAYIKGEFWGPYLGFLPLTGILLLISTSAYRLLQGKLELIAVQFWLLLWILLFSLIGGINLLMGSFGFVLFRGTNRYSIFILTIGLLFLVRFLSRKCPKSLIFPAAFILIFLGLGEQLTGRFLTPPGKVNPVVEAVNSDRNFALSVEAQAPNSMVFQLPIAGFPEVPPVNKMGDYEHFRPFLFTKTLHYSYGTNKGRGDADWQSQVAKLPPLAMAAKLESYGFQVIMINKKGYLDGGQELIKELVAGGKRMIAENQDLVAFRLSPSSSRSDIDLWPSFGNGWSADELTHRWSESSHTNLLINNYGSQSLPYTLSFKLLALGPRVVKVSYDNRLLASLNLALPGEASTFPPTRLILKPGLNTIAFDTDAPAINPGNGDPRSLSFQLSDFQFTPGE